MLQPASAVTAAQARPRLHVSLTPVAADTAPEPARLQVSDLVKAAGLAEAALAEERALQARRAAAGCDADLDGLGAVKPWLHTAAQFLSCLHDRPTVIGVAHRPGRSDHPSGHAIDLMTSRERGDRIAGCALANRDVLGVDYVIWRQRVNHGDGREPMADRASATANHYDHVHISFERSAPDGDPNPERCA